MGLFTKDIATMDDLFVHQLKDIYYAEKRILKSLPKMIDKATAPELKSGFQRHLAETETHVTRLERELGRNDCAEVLRQTLEEEKATDAKLTQMAESRINRKAA